MNGIRRSVLQNNKLLRQLCPQRPPKPSFPTETLRQQSFSPELTICLNTVLSWHWIWVLIWRGTTFFLFKITSRLHYTYSLRLSELPEAIKSWRHKIYHTFPFLQNDMFSFNYNVFFFNIWCCHDTHCQKSRLTTLARTCCFDLQVNNLSKELHLRYICSSRNTKPQYICDKKQEITVKYITSSQVLRVKMLWSSRYLDWQFPAISGCSKNFEEHTGGIG